MYTYLEIGSNCVNTLNDEYASSPDWCGTSVEALPGYFDQLIKYPKNTYHNAVCVVDNREQVPFYSVPPEVIKANNFPDWLHGCGSLVPGLQPHYNSFYTTTILPTISLEKLLEGKKIDLLKLDVEGYDYTILTTMLSRLQVFPDQILFEIAHMTAEQVGALNKLLAQSGYECCWRDQFNHKYSKIPAQKGVLRLHVVGLPHTDCNQSYSGCPFTQQIFNFCKMMKSLGHVVYHYGGADSSPDCDETVTIATLEQRTEWFGGTNGWDDLQRGKWPTNSFWDRSTPVWTETNKKTIEEIKKRIQPRDFICVIGGSCNKPIADAFTQHTVEIGVGFTGSFSLYRIFVSYALMHQTYGMYNRKPSEYSVNDEVIPLSFIPENFTFSKEKDDYFLFIGRLIQDKGPHVAAMMAQQLGVKLLVASNNEAADTTPGHIVNKEGLHIVGPVEWVGHLNAKRRGELMSRARAVIVPSEYIEPFGAVVAEAMLTGTPVISTDWGSFPEIIQDGVNGYRCRTLGEMVWAGKHVGGLDPTAIRDSALSRYSVDVLKYRYEDYFFRLQTLWGKGWYDLTYDGHEKREKGGFR